MRKTKTNCTRVDKSLYDLIAKRKDYFGTSWREESKNLVDITRKIEQQLGLDITKVRVRKKSVIDLNLKKKIVILK